MRAKKKVIFCTYSSIYSAKVLAQLMVSQDIELIAIINSTRVLRPSFNPIQGALAQLKLSGLRYSTYLFLITDFFKWIQPLLALRQGSLRDIHVLAKRHNIPIIDTRDINSAEVVDSIIKYNPDILLCAHFNQLLKKSIFAIKTMQCINIHPSLLPQYKGVDPVFYAMLDNAEKIGVTLHKMDEDFDSGELLLQTEMEIEADQSLLATNCQLFEAGAKLAIRWLKSDQNDAQIQLKNNHSSEYYDSWPSSKEVRDFKKSGNILIRLSGLWKQ